MSNPEGHQQPYLPGFEADTPKRRSAVGQWRCPNCGQHIFVAITADLPEICAYCADMTTWQPIQD